MPRPKTNNEVITAYISPTDWTLLNKVSSALGVDLKGQLEKQLQAHLDSIVEKMTNALKEVQKPTDQKTVDKL